MTRKKKSRTAQTDLVRKEIIDERTLIIEDEICSEFGCARKLTLMEKLCGKKCVFHSIKKIFFIY